MLIMDIPDVPPHYTPIIVAEKSQATQANYERTIGVCKPIENSTDPTSSAINSVSPVIAAMSYIEKIEHKKFSGGDYLSLYNAAKMTLLQAPTNAWHVRAL